MNSTQQDQAALYALGLLDPAEASAFEQHLAADPDLRQMVDELLDTTAALALTIPETTAPAALKANVMAAISTRPQSDPEPRFPAPSVTPASRARSRGSRRWAPSALVAWGLAAALVLSLTLLWRQDAALREARVALAKADAERVAADAQTSRRGLELAAVRAELAGLQARNALARMQIATLTTSLAEYQQGVAVVVWDSTQGQGVLKLEKMPPVAPGKDYQLWVVDPQQPAPVDAGVVRVDSSGFARVTFKPVQPVDEAAKFALSLEREGGVAKGEGPVVLIGP